MLSLSLYIYIYILYIYICIYHIPHEGSIYADMQQRSLHRYRLRQCQKPTCRISNDEEPPRPGLGSLTTSYQQSLYTQTTAIMHQRDIA